MQEYYFTPEGFAKVQAEIDRLEGLIGGEISAEIGKARAHGDFRENAEYDAAKERLENCMERIESLRVMVRSGRTVDIHGLPADRVTMGKRVTLEDLSGGGAVTYTILGEGEADVDKNVILYRSPIARALMGKREGIEVSVELPRETKRFRILKIEPHEA